MTFLIILLFIFMIIVPVLGNKITEMIAYVNMKQSVTTKMNNALDSRMFSRMTTVGKRLLRQNIGDEQYRQFDAVSGLADMAMPQSKRTTAYSSASTNNNKLVRSAERLFNDGRTFQVSKDYPYSKWKLDSDITKTLSDARYILN